MGLHIKIPAGGVVVINGAVIENTGSEQADLRTHNHVDLMREKHILNKEDATTPIKRVYFTGQHLLIERHGNTSANIQKFLNELEQLRAVYQASPAVEHIEQAIDRARNGEYYKSLSALRDVFYLEE